MGRSLGLIAALVAMAGPVPAAQGQTPGQQTTPAGTRWDEVYVPSEDGTPLHVDLLRPDDPRPGERFGVLLVITPYGAHLGDPAQGHTPDPLRAGPVHPLRVFTAVAPWQRRMAVAYADMRGFGASEGCIDFGGERDREDTLALIRWAASQGWSNGRVVVGGLSYAGIPPLLALADPPAALKGVVPMAALGSLYRGMYMNEVHYDLLWYGVSAYYTSVGLQPGSAADDPRHHAGHARGLGAECLADHHREHKDPDRSAAYWRRREWGAAAAGSRVPVLASHGLLDPNVKPDDFVGWWRGMRGWRSAWVGQFHHGSAMPANTGRDGFTDQLARFLEATLKGGELPDGDRGVDVQEGPSGRWRREAAWPPDDVEDARFELLPGEYADAPGNRAEPADPVGDGTTPQALAAREGIGTWTFSPPLERELHLAGEPALDLRTRGPAGANAIALLYDVHPDGRAWLISRGAARLARDRARFRLLPQDWRVAAGHRIGVLISGSDESWWAPLNRSLATVRVVGGDLRLPALATSRTEFVSHARGHALDRHRPIAVPVEPRERTGELTVAARP